jgi:hypothetical protein
MEQTTTVIPLGVFDPDKRTVIYLDVDGVLNSFQSPEVLKKHWPDFEVVSKESPERFVSISMVLSRRLGTAIRAYAETIGAEIVWATSHGSYVDMFDQESGMTSHMRSIECYGEEVEPGLIWKMGPVSEDFDDRNVIWVDDELTEEDAVYLTRQGISGFLVIPDPFNGITNGDLETLDVVTVTPHD